MEYLGSFITIGMISVLAAMSPGPDFIVVAKNSLLGSKRVGIYTAFGVSSGILLHVTYSLFGIGLIISQSILIFALIKYLGALYLFYLGYQLLKTESSQGTKFGDEKIATITFYKSFKEGFLTNALNPKVTLFFLSIFTQTVDPNTPFSIQIMLGLEVALIVGIWFIALTLIITYEPTKLLFSKFHYYLMKIMGATLLLLSIKLALTTT